MLQKVVSEAATNFFPSLFLSCCKKRFGADPKVAKETTDSVARVVIFPLTEAVRSCERISAEVRHTLHGNVEHTFEVFLEVLW